VHCIATKVRDAVAKDTIALIQRFEANALDATIPLEVRMRGVRVSKHFRFNRKTVTVKGAALPTPAGVRSAMRKPGRRASNHKHDRKHALQNAMANVADHNLQTHRKIVELRKLHAMAHTRRLKDKIFKDIRALERSL